MGDTGDAAEVIGVKDAEDTIRRRTTKTYVNNVRNVTPKKQRKSKQEIANIWIAYVKCTWAKCLR